MPRLTVVVSTHNRADALAGCLDALGQQTASADSFEVVVADGGSTDGTAALLARLRTSFELRVVTAAGGPASARNAGARAGRGRHCLFLGDDVVPRPQLVAEHLRVVGDRDDVACLGRFEIEAPDAPAPVAAWLRRRAADRHTRLTREPARLGDWDERNLSLARRTFLESGGFSPSLEALAGFELAARLTEPPVRVHPVYAAQAVAVDGHHGGVARIVEDAEREGTENVALYLQSPSLLTDLELGGFEEASPTRVAMRRLALTVPLPPRLLAAVGPLYRGDRTADFWLSFLRSYSFWSAARRALPEREAWARLTRGVTILMYHAFARDSSEASRFVIPERRFAAQMRWLTRRAAPVIDLADVAAWRLGDGLPPAGAVAITVDDGYVDNRLVAEPILRRYGLPATIFIVTARVGGTNDWDRGELTGRRLLSWDDIDELRDAGVAFGAHTRTHRELPSLREEEARSEIEGSRSDLEDRLGLPVSAFAYPHGRVDDGTAALVEEAGFAFACGIRSGRNGAVTPPFALRRLEVDGRYSLARFIAGVWFGDFRPPRRVARIAARARRRLTT